MFSTASFCAKTGSASSMRILVTGGAGFIGANLVHHLLNTGHQVTVFDNLLRPGTEKNLAWLREQHRDGFRFVQGDIRDAQQMRRVAEDVDVVYHLAGQVAVTTSVQNPREDFTVNSLGTLNVLEALRQVNSNAILIFTSTNKVYGGMENVAVVENETRYVYRDHPNGISEGQPLDFHSPYGCSKGAADQYVRDYARIYGLRTVVFRMSCIYGPRQFGNEDQGWLAHFVISAVLGRPITIYGDGRQVRDVLYVDDLIQAFEGAVEHIDVAAGQVYNIGGGPENTVSIWAEFGELLAERLGRRIAVRYGDWRPGDQRVYVSDIRKAQTELGWSPTISVTEGIERLCSWVLANRAIFD